ncbi:hypothetical protein JTE90_007087 [Oedothorax gibbosus]|uniref:Uncharacterized protein n=1 Tax=Oedothorax gibbosus TaxID=931172 RepID=A0AAV6VPN9_9ARAC|nr:hypothetical protein JTE90_007087 [Oedothorax gibbosus]
MYVGVCILTNKSEILWDKVAFRSLSGASEVGDWKYSNSNVLVKELVKRMKMRLCDLTFLLFAVWLYANVIDAIALEDKDTSPEMSGDNYLSLRQMLLDGILEKSPFFDENMTPKRGTQVKQLPPGFQGVRGRRSDKNKLVKDPIPGFLGVRGKKDLSRTQCHCNNDDNEFEN